MPLGKFGNQKLSHFGYKSLSADFPPEAEEKIEINDFA